MNKNYNFNHNRNQNQNQIQMPQRFNAGYNFARNMQNMPQWQQQLPQPQLQPQPQQQFGMFYEDRGNQRLAIEPTREPQFRQEQFNRGPIGGPQNNLRRFNRSPDRPQFNRSPERGPGSGYQQAQRNLLEREPAEGYRQSFSSPARGAGFPLNRSPERDLGYQRGLERGSDFHLPNRELGFQQTMRDSALGPGYQQSMRDPAPEGFQMNLFPSSYRRQRSHSPENMELNEGGRRSRSSICGMRQFSPTYSGEHSPRRSGDREASPYRQAAINPGPRHSSGQRHSMDYRPELTRNRNGDGNGNDAKRPRKKWEMNLPPLGQPGARDDPNKRNLSGSRTKWYMRYLQRGFQPEEAFRMAKEPKQPAANYESAPDLPATEQSSKWEKPSEEDLADESDNTMEHIASTDNVQERDLQICLLPVGYPQAKLSQKDKKDLEEAILQEVVTAGFSSSAPLRFTHIRFKGGYLKVTCSDRISAEWLMSRGAHLYSYRGHPVIPKLGAVNSLKPKRFYVTVFLSQTAGKTDEFIFALLKSQNQYKTHLWKLISRKDQSGGALLVLSIDPESATDIAANDYFIYYRYGKVPVHGLRKKFGDKSPPRYKKASAKRDGESPKAKPAETVVEEEPILMPVLKQDPVEIADESPLCIDLVASDDDAGDP